jgi:hypothetical protein
MAELEIHHEGSEEHDPFGQKIGIVAAIIGVLLAVVTIMSHRAHTDAVIHKTEANDKWAYYQSKSIKRSEYVIAKDLLTATAGENEKTKKVLDRFEKEQERYNKETEEIKKEADEIDLETKHIERQALRYDIGEGLLELGLVLCSLYFISRKQLFPLVGVIAALAGLAAAITGYVVH